MRLRRWILLLFFILIIANYAIPYLALSSARGLSGAFMFWILISLIAIALVMAASWGWRE